MILQLRNIVYVKELLAMDKNKGVVIRIKVEHERYVVNKKRKEFYGKYGANAGKSETELACETKEKGDDGKGGASKTHSGKGDDKKSGDTKDDNCITLEFT
eukprot:162303_1